MSFKESLKKVGINEKEVIDWRTARFYESSPADNCSSSYKGYILLTKKSLVFVSERKMLIAPRKLYDVPIKKIVKIGKVPLTSTFIFNTNMAENNSGFFAKLFKSRAAQISIEDGVAFIDKIKKMNPNIK